MGGIKRWGIFSKILVYGVAASVFNLFSFKDYLDVLYSAQDKLLRMRGFMG